MRHEEFTNLLDRHGPDLDSWPPASRAKAMTALAVDPELASLLETERLLVEALATLPPSPASASLRQAVMDIPLAHPRQVRQPSGLAALLAGVQGAWRQWSAGMATASAAAFFGFVLGYGQMLPAAALGTDRSTNAEDLVALLNLTADYDAVDVEQGE